MADMQRSSGPRLSGPAPGQTVYWVIAVLLAAIAGGLWLRPTEPWLRSAVGQQQLAGARGVYAFTGPLDRDRYGLFMLDVDQGTIWCYAFESAGQTQKLRLVAARTWVYDRYLQDFNCAPPDFRMVQQLVSEQRVRAAGELQRETRVHDAAEPDQPGDEE